MICRSYATIFFVLSTTTQFAAGGDRSLNDRFIAEYSAGFRRLERFYRNIDMTEETTGPGADAIFGGTVTFHWRARGAEFRDDVVSLSGAIGQSKVSRGDVNCRVYTTAQARLAQVQPGKTYALTEVHRGDDDSLLEIARSSSARLAFAPYCVYEATVMDLVKMDPIEVTALEETAPGKVRLVYTTHGNAGVKWDSELLFDKENSWALLSLRTRRVMRNVEYGQSIDGVPVATRVTHYWNGDFKKPAFVSVLKDIKPGPVPDSVFTLAEFGLPELPRQKKPGFPIFATLGLTGLAVSVLLAWFIQKRSRTQAQAAAG